MNASLKPEDRIRRSHLYRVCRDGGAHWVDMNGFAMPAHYGDAAVEAKAAAHLAIADLTALPRSGFKGWGMADWASGQGVVLPEPNLAIRQQDGTLACRLSSGELLLLADGEDGDLIGHLDRAWSIEDAVCYPVPRADASAHIAVTGSEDCIDDGEDLRCRSQGPPLRQPLYRADQCRAHECHRDPQ